jgi:hypothetical protein
MGSHARDPGAMGGRRARRSTARPVHSGNRPHRNAALAALADDASSGNQSPQSQGSQASNWKPVLAILRSVAVILEVPEARLAREVGGVVNVL